MPAHDAPAEIIALADARSAARRARDWETADRLKAAIEAAGWKVIDAATLYTLEPLAPADVEEAGVVRYGASSNVPSRLDEEPVGTATVVVVADRDLDAVARTVGAVVARAPDGTQLVVVANAVDDADAAALAALDAADPGAPGVMTEVVRTAVPFGYGAALNAGIRRASAPVVVVLRAGVEPRGDLAGAIARALDDERVAVAGPIGLVTDDLRVFERADRDDVPLDAIHGAALGFRRADYVARGPIDEQLTVPAYLDAWWSLVLRDLAEEDDIDADPRLAVRVGEVAPDGVPDDTAGGPVRTADKAAKRTFYRYLRFFATRRDLLAGPAGAEVRARLRSIVGPGSGTSSDEA